MPNVTISNPVVIDNVQREVGEVVNVVQDVADRLVASGYANPTGSVANERLLGRLAAAQVVNNSAAFVNVPDLNLGVLANRVYEFEAVLPYDSAAAADIQFKFTVPAGCTMLWTLDAPDTAATAVAATKSFDVMTETGAKAAGGIAVGTRVMARVKGIINTGATAGTVQLQMAQATATASATTLAAGSLIKASRTI